MLLSSYELYPGFIQIYLGSGKSRVAESRIDLDAGYTVEPIALPSRPYCVRISPTINDDAATIVIESDSAEQQSMWVSAISEEIHAASKA